MSQRVVRSKPTSCELRVNELQVYHNTIQRVASLPHCELRVVNQQACELQANKPVKRESARY